MDVSSRGRGRRRQMAGRRSMKGGTTSTSKRCHDRGHTAGHDRDERSTIGTTGDVLIRDRAAGAADRDGAARGWLLRRSSRRREDGDEHPEPAAVVACGGSDVCRRRRGGAMRAGAADAGAIGGKDPRCRGRVRILRPRPLHLRLPALDGSDAAGLPPSGPRRHRSNEEAKGAWEAPSDHLRDRAPRQGLSWRAMARRPSGAAARRVRRGTRQTLPAHAPVISPARSTGHRRCGSADCR